MTNLDKVIQERGHIPLLYCKDNEIKAVHEGDDIAIMTEIPCPKCGKELALNIIEGSLAIPPRYVTIHFCPKVIDGCGFKHICNLSYPLHINMPDAERSSFADILAGIEEEIMGVKE